MSDTEYGAALKLGKKQYQDSVAKGEYPYLPVLDEALSYTEIVSQVSLGTMDIPWELRQRNGLFLLQIILCRFSQNVLSLLLNGRTSTITR